jgi:PD-(D/E)XK nuclease superfamily protein
MYAALYYVGNGHQVYWPQVKQDATDFIVDKDGTLYRVQVKGACWVKSGTFSYLQARMRSTGKYTFMPSDNLYDIMFCVHEDEAWEIPAALVHSSNICLRGSRPGRKPEAWDEYKVL